LDTASGRSISNPLAELDEVTDRIGQRDLRIPADIDWQNENGQRAGAFNRLQTNLQGGNKMKTAA
jgi:methyl-accepting chemotaxis protein